MDSIKKKELHALIGRGLGHSLSPEVHYELGIKDYGLMSLEPGELESFMRKDEIAFVSVTMPYKTDVMKYLDAVSDDAARIGSVNTVIRKKEGLTGYNTDIDGFKFSLKAAGFDVTHGKILVLGSGGASKAVRAALEDEGVKEIITVSRTGENNYDNLERNYDAEIIINATPIGMFPYLSQSPVELVHFTKCRGVFDLIYRPLRTELLLQAERLGIPCINGLMMVIAQARTAEELYRKCDIPDSEVIRIYDSIIGRTDNIVLIGMPGCGKTSIGKALSELTGLPVYDSDDMIAEKAGKSIERIFKEDGEAVFREFEKDAIKEMGEMRGIIAVTGGGAVKTPENLSALRANGTVYHIERNISELSREGRPLSKGADLEKMYAERLPLYEKFRNGIIVNDSTPEAAANKIWRMHNEDTRYKRTEH